jgi:phosphoesterase RecJ-like protein
MFLPDVEHVIYQPDFLIYESVIVLDCGELRLTGFLAQLEKMLRTKQLGTVINIDHHLQDPPYGHLALVDPSASATGLLVYHLARSWGATIDAPAATALLATLYHDTGSFQHSNVDAKTLRMAAECVRLGADAPEIAKRMFRSKTMQVLKLWGRALERAR